MFFVGWNVVKYSLLSCLACIVCLTGCKSQDSLNNSTKSDNIAAYSNIISEYIQKERLPDLESIEPWQNIYGPGVKISTRHYEVYATLMDRFLLSMIPAFLESAYNVYSNQIPEPVGNSTKFPIYLFANRTQWEQFTGAFAGNQAEIFYKIKAGAYYHNGACVVYDIGMTRTLSALGHEGWHQFSSRHFKYRLPSWLDEGVAMLFETYSNNNGTITFEPYKNEYRISALKKTLSSNKMIPLNELTAINPGQVLASDQAEAVSAFYSQSYALVRFLREYNHGIRHGIYNQLLTDGFLGRWPLDEVSKEIATDRNLPRTILWNHIVGTQLFLQYINDDFEEIEQEYKAFCRQITQ